MNIIKFNFENYRNLKLGNIEPCEGVNIIYGNNAQGKTNLIEAIWLFTGEKSFRSSKDAEIIPFDKKIKTRLDIDFISEQRQQNCKINIDNSEKIKKEIYINGVKKGTPDLIGKFCAVVFSPMHLSLVKDGPEKRRNFIDGALCQIKPSLVKIFYNYKKALNQRNALLKDLKYNYDLIDVLDVWDYKLSELGSIIISERIKYCNKISRYSEQIYKGISELKESLSISYQSNINLENEVEKLKEYLFNKMKKNLKQDIFQGFTSNGPHRDDINILINDKSARKFGSQGQQRSAVLALKLSEASILKESIGENPIILLDDVLSELDMSRQRYLLNNIKDKQVFITSCESEIITNKNCKKFKMKDGIIS